MSSRPNPSPRPLTGVRVLELGELVSAPYGSKLLADLGADVIKIESSSGDVARRRGPFRRQPDPDASGLFLALNTNKRSYLTDDGSDHLDSLLAEADIVLSNLGASRLNALGIDLEALHDQRPELVICSVTPFGLTGPYDNYEATELIVTNAGGWAYQCPGASPEDDKPPLKVFGHQTDFHAGMAAATVALAAHRKASQTGVGDLIDLSAMAHTTGMLEAAFIAASYMDENPGRLGSRLLNPWGIFPCSDGLIFLVCVEQDQWERLVAFMGDPEWCQIGLFDTLELRLENEDLLTHYISEFTSEYSVADLWHRGQAERICFAPVQTMEAMARQDHLHQREFFQTVDHPVAGPVCHLGPPFLSSNRLWGPLAPAPLLDPDSAPVFGHRSPVDKPRRSARPADRMDRPLAGVRVIDFSWVWAGPYCTMHLAHLGAEVIKIESSDRPGLGRRLALHPPDVEPTLNTSAYFNQWDQGKLSAELDLTDDAAIETIKRLVGSADVVVENFATGVMERLGLGFDDLRKLNPELIMASISGYGSSGPLKNYMGYGPTTGPLSGLTSLTGYLDGAPRELGISVGDPGAGITAAFAIVAALTDRRPGQEGCYIDVALWESTTSNAVEGWMSYELTGQVPARMGNRDPLMSPHGCFRSVGDDEWVAVACVDDDAWRRLAAVVDPALLSDSRFVTAGDRKQNEDALEELLTAWTSQRTRWEASEALQAVGVAAFPSMSPMDLLNDPHLESRQFIERLDHPEVGRRAHTGVPWQWRNAPNGVTQRAPLLGEHTARVVGLVE